MVNRAVDIKTIVLGRQRESIQVIPCQCEDSPQLARDISRFSPSFPAIHQTSATCGFLELPSLCGGGAKHLPTGGETHWTQRNPGLCQLNWVLSTAAALPGVWWARLWESTGNRAGINADIGAASVPLDYHVKKRQLARRLNPPSEQGCREKAPHCGKTNAIEWKFKHRVAFLRKCICSLWLRKAQLLIFSLFANRRALQRRVCYQAVTGWLL